MATFTKKSLSSVFAYQARSSSKLFTGNLFHQQGTYNHFAFMPGCSLASHSPLIIKRVYQHLYSNFPGIALMQQCCANPLLSVGEKEAFTNYYSKVQHILDTYKITTVITACENCFMTMQKASPRIKVESLYTILAKTKMPQRDYSNMPIAALHDPCPTRKETAIHENTRILLKNMQYPFEEFSRNRTKTVCCGSGGMLPLLNPAKALLLMQERCRQTNCDVIISYCQACVDSLHKEGKRSIHLLDLLFGDIVLPDFKQKQQNLLRRWFNRYQSKCLTYGDQDMCGKK